MSDALTVKRLRSLHARIEKSKAKIAAERDNLRALVSQMEDLLEPLDRACESLEFGLADLNSAVDSLSEQL